VGWQMKWFKHDSDACQDAKLRKVRMKYGAQGYGIYWYCLELVARNVEGHNLTFELEHDAELIAEDFKISSELVQEMMKYMVDLGLFENNRGVITCLKMATRTDEYTQKLMRNSNKYHDNVRTLSGESHDSVSIKSDLIEEKRREEKDIGQKRNRFMPPSLQDIIEYCHQRKNDIDPQGFRDFYESKGWMVGKNKMKDWKACVRTWEKKNQQEKVDYQ